mgnify:CR=1 FL=1
MPTIDLAASPSNQHSFHPRKTRYNILIGEGDTMVPGLNVVPGCEEILRSCDARSFVWDGQQLTGVTSSRPRQRADCAGVARPCPHIACRYHLMFESDPVSGSLRMKPLAIQYDTASCSCALDMAEMRIQSIDEMKYVASRHPDFLDEQAIN